MSELFDNPSIVSFDVKVGTAKPEGLFLLSAPTDRGMSTTLNLWLADVLDGQRVTLSSIETPPAAQAETIGVALPVLEGEKAALRLLEEIRSTLPPDRRQDVAFLTLGGAPTVSQSVLAPGDISDES